MTDAPPFLAEAPPPFLASVLRTSGRHSRAANADQVLVDADSPAALNAFARVVAAEPIIAAGRDDRCLVLAREARDLGVSQEMAATLMEPWATRCSYPHEPAGTARGVSFMVDQGYRHGAQNAFGSKAAEHVLSSVNTQGMATTAILPTAVVAISEAPIVRRIVTPGMLAGKTVPETQWIVPGWIPRRKATILYGNGGDGKTTVAQQLQNSMALGRPWLSLPVIRGRSLGVYCEDGDADLHKRQSQIQRSMGTDFSNPDLAAMSWWSREDEENNDLLTFARGGYDFAITRLFDEIVGAAKDHKADLIILDTAADLYPDDENDRAKVRRFVGILKRAARVCNAGVLLLAHPSKEGMRSGSMDSGSTGWSNTVRSRLALMRPPLGGKNADENARILVKKKSNFSSIGDEVSIRWRAGVFEVNDPILGSNENALVEQLSRAKDAEEALIRLVDHTMSVGVYFSVARNAGNYAPRTIARQYAYLGFTQDQVERAMWSLIDKQILGTDDTSRDKIHRNRSHRLVTMPGRSTWEVPRGPRVPIEDIPAPAAPDNVIRFPAPPPEPLAEETNA